MQLAALPRHRVHAPARAQATRKTVRRFIPPVTAAQAGKQHQTTDHEYVDRVLKLLQQGASLYATGAVGQSLAAAVADLVSSNSNAQPGTDSLSQGQGTWEVFYAPHIAKLSAAFGARFEPIRYTLRGNALISNVRYSHPLLGTGWLSASGTIAAADDTTLLLHFDRFWVDFGGDALRPELPPLLKDQDSSGDSGSTILNSSTVGSRSVLDAVVSALGRAAFLPALARFPVEYLDGGSGMAVFRFPPLASSIAILRASTSMAGPQAAGALAAADPGAREQ